MIGWTRAILFGRSMCSSMRWNCASWDSMAATGRPGYHPSPMLKLYIYGYLNRVQSSRRLEREAGRNLEVMWLTERLVPDHKTIADFRKDNGSAIKKVCAQFVALCRKMGLLAKASVAIDGSKFKAVNSRDNNFTKGKMERRLAQIEESVARYLSQLDTADRQTASGEAPSEELVARTMRLKEKLIKLEEEVKRLKAIEKVMLAAPDQQVSFTDPDSRSMATSGRGSGMVGYNVQAAVDTTNHLIVAHEVTNVGTDKSHLANMANQAKAALEAENLEAFADRGYFNGEEILACDEAGITVTLPKPQTSEAKSEGRFGKQLPRHSGWAYSSLYFTQPYQPSPKGLSGRPAHRPFRGLLGVYSRYGLHTRTPIRDTHSEGFSYLVTSIAAPVASGWSGCRVGLAPTGKRRLVTAHTQRRHFEIASASVTCCRCRSQKGNVA